MDIREAIQNRLRRWYLDVCSQQKIILTIALSIIGIRKDVVFG